jgi:hypothetical protein
MKVGSVICFVQSVGKLLIILVVLMVGSGRQNEISSSTILVAKIDVEMGISNLDGPYGL